MQMCDEATAKFMGEALLNHAKGICRYARTYATQRHPVVARQKHLREKFDKNLRRMLKEMHALMLMAKYKGVSRFCNREQIDAYVEEANRYVEVKVENFSQSAPLLN